MAILTREFYTGDTVELAQKLLGKYLVRRYGNELLVGRIMETEAYVGAIDKACHAYNYHKTKRNATMFGPPGHGYIYRIYGMYMCLNFVTNPVGEPDAVLLRGLQPIAGAETMCRLRYGKAWAELTAYQKKNFLNGPGKCCMALDLDTSQDGIDLCSGGELFLCDSPADIGLPEQTYGEEEIVAAKRVGVDYAEDAAEWLWRFILC